MKFKKIFTYKMDVRASDFILYLIASMLGVIIKIMYFPYLDTGLFISILVISSHCIVILYRIARHVKKKK